MELKTNYQYTYFIHPFIIKEQKYSKYIEKILRNNKCNIKIFEKERDLGVYKYFTPKSRELLFSSISFTQEKLNKLEELPIDTRTAILSKYPCTVFEYNIKKDIQGKADVQNGIFFKIQKCEIICFNTGICFISFKTNIEDSESFSDVLNFNYKFRDINEENIGLSNYDNIRIQTDSFDNAKKLTDFIHEITGSLIETIKIDLDFERFYTYSYVCIDQKDWNQNKEFELIRPAFYKFANILKTDASFQFNDNGIDNIKTLSKWKYAKMGITKKAVTLFSSSTDINNFCILPTDFENQYFYTYIITLYKKIYLKKLETKLINSLKRNNKKLRKEFVEFTKKMWTVEVSEDETGSIFEKNLKDVLEIDDLYSKVKNKYDLMYKELKIEKNTKVTYIIIVLLIISLIFNVLSYISLLK